MIDIIPGILENDLSEIEKKFEIIRPFSRKVHIDILDGMFCEEASFMDPESFKKYKDDFFMEVHLMVENPFEYVKPFAKAGFKRFLGHIEKMRDLEEFIAEGQIAGEVGIAIDLHTSLDGLLVPFDDLDCVLLMGVKAGKSGQTFSSQTLEKIKILRQKTGVPIEIDGGMNEETITSCMQEGAERFVINSYLFQSKDPMETYEKLLSL